MSTTETSQATEVGSYFISNYPPFSQWKTDNVPDAIAALDHARSEDLARALAIDFALDTPASAAVVLPDAAWSRRVSGTLANHLATTSPSRATAVLTPSGVAYTVSLRAPQEHPHGAERLAQAFGGGGRAAAGINGLPASDVARFLEAFRRAFTST